MRVRCPRCKTELDIADEDHYRELPCPSCGGTFQAVTEATQQVSREFLREILGEIEKKPE